MQFVGAHALRFTMKTEVWSYVTGTSGILFGNTVVARCHFSVRDKIKLLWLKRKA